MDRSDFEVLQRAVLPAFAPLLRKHLTDPEYNTIELCFLLHAGLVVGGLLPVSYTHLTLPTKRIV